MGIDIRKPTIACVSLINQPRDFEDQYAYAFEEKIDIFPQPLGQELPISIFLIVTMDMIGSQVDQYPG
jgi:hypothetical protein